MTEGNGTHDEPRLGCATTRELLEELTARADVAGYADYRTVDEPPGSYWLVGDDGEAALLMMLREESGLRAAVRKLLAGCLIQLVADLTVRVVKARHDAPVTQEYMAAYLTDTGALVLGKPFHAPPFFDAVQDWAERQANLDLGEDGLNFWRDYGLQEHQLQLPPDCQPPEAPAPEEVGRVEYLIGCLRAHGQLTIICSSEVPTATVSVVLESHGKGCLNAHRPTLLEALEVVFAAVCREVCSS